MKKLAAIICVLFIVPSCFVHADEYGELEKIIPQEAKDILDDMDIEGINTESASETDLIKVMSAVLPNIDKNIKAPLKSVGALFCILLICAMLNVMNTKESPGRGCDIAVSAAASLCVLAPACTFLARTSAIISSASGFMTAYVPIYTGLLIAQGTPTAAAGYSTSLFAACEIISIIFSRFFLPVSGVLLGLSALSGFGADNVTGRITASAKNGVKWSLTAVSGLFVTFLSLQSTISAASDSLLLKSGKIVSGFVPVVGSALSDSLSVLAGSASVIKSGVGVFGVIVLLALLIPVIIEFIIWLVGTRIVCACSEILGAGSVGKVIKGVSDAIEICFAIVMSVSAVFIISTAVMIKVSV